MKVVGIDGDTLVYRCGFAAESGGEVQPLAHALQIVKQAIDGILEATEADDFIVYLSGTGNFREEVAVTHEYKGNRKDARKPVHYDAIRTYLIEQYGAEVIDGQEADDALGIFLTKDIKNHICCSIDKDLLMVPGLHYNWVKKEFTYIDKTTGLINFFKQLLTGDDIDNIKGLNKIGEKTADTILCNALAGFLPEVVQEVYGKSR